MRIFGFNISRNRQVLTDYSATYIDESMPRSDIVPKGVIRGQTEYLYISKERLLDGPLMQSWALIQERGTGNLSNHSLYLNDSYDWVIVRDSDNVMCLVPLKREMGNIEVTEPSGQ